MLRIIRLGVKQVPGGHDVGGRGVTSLPRKSRYIVGTTSNGLAGRLVTHLPEQDQLVVGGSCVDPVIASLSFGAERDFFLRRKADHDDKTVFSLGGGAALLMAGKCQKDTQV